MNGHNINNNNKNNNNNNSLLPVKIRKFETNRKEVGGFLLEVVLVLKKHLLIRMSNNRKWFMKDILLLSFLFSSFYCKSPIPMIVSALQCNSNHHSYYLSSIYHNSHRYYNNYHCNHYYPSYSSLSFLHPSTSSTTSSPLLSSSSYYNFNNNNNNQDDTTNNKETERKRIIKHILDQEDNLIEQELIEKKKKHEEVKQLNQKIMTKIAKNVGVTMTTLERTKTSFSTTEQEQQQKKIDNDDDLHDDRMKPKTTTTTLTSRKKKTTTSTNSTIEQTHNNHTDTTTNKKEIFHSKEQGTHVGSAGGWSLEIFPGDFVVHRKYGIGKFIKTLLVDVQVEEGSPQYVAQQERRKKLIRAAKKAGWQIPKIKKLISTFGTEADQDLISRPRTTMLELSYHDGLVHVPIEKAYRLSRYKSSDVAIPPKLSRIRGDNTWKKAREKVAQMTIEMAQDVLALYATRETLMRPPFDPRKEADVKLFGTTFPYEPTPDQLSCFETIENDMVWRRRPMDRLICGDVGFGKTEVAMRALFRCVANGRQAVLLAPTGVLAAQHYKTVTSRMGPDTPFKVNIGFLRGGMSQKSGKEIRSKIETGEIQLIVGTHALLSKTVPYNNIGLLVIDEEQRFGVKQKERLKMLSSGVDVLTLSATPIPRTLQMSLSGIRDTSSIRSPPPSRKSIVSVVECFSESLVYEAISRELSRGGQCFYVVPRISMISEATEMIQNIFPNIRITVAHGRMGAGTAEANVEAFAEGNFDLLLATTVIENGVDIPSVNTIIIQDAQNYGMATLYQLRGRVGRSNLQGYAYFLHEALSLSDQAVARLQAMAELHELGSGFDVAARDLEIRGAGSLLGTEQSGMAERVGFDLYMRMLKKSIRQLRALDLPNVPRTNILLPQGEGSIDSSSSFFTIPPSYIPDDVERLKQEGAARIAESTAKLVELTNEWKELFGPLPSILKEQMKTLHVHSCTRSLGIDLVGLIDTLEGSSTDLILRCPGLRLRHWVTICAALNGMPPVGLDAVFPARFSPSGDELVIIGGMKLESELMKFGQGDEQAKSTALALLSEDEDDGWDGFDEEEVEAMKDVTSAVNIKSLDEIDIGQYPRLVISSFSNDVPLGKRIDALLKILLPLSNVVNEKHKEDKDKAMAAVQLRERREAIKKAHTEAKKRGQLRNDFI